MKIRKLLIVISSIVLISACNGKMNYYKIHQSNKVLAIYIPTFSDTAYAYIGTKKIRANVDSFDFKINNRNEATEVSLILNKHKNDTIYYSDRWNDVTLVNKNGKYKRISWHDDRFYVKDIRTNRIQINHNYEPTLKSKACLKCLYFTIIIFDLCRYLEYFSYLCTINQTE